MLINEEQLYDNDDVDNVLTEAIKTLIPTSLKKKLASKKNRQLMLEKYGDNAFLLPKQLKFPVLDPTTGKPNCALIYAARIRAKQYSGIKPGYRELASKAEEMYKENHCSVKLNIQINTEDVTIDTDLMNIVNILY
ncbi:MAG: hypothetical protein WC188_03975 [Candidatus Caldatribacteriota bacterium]|nr:hypothetical protein [Patescibacteria group bacterium]